MWRKKTPTTAGIECKCEQTVYTKQSVTLIHVHVVVSFNKLLDTVLLVYFSEQMVIKVLKPVEKHELLNPYTLLS